MRQGFNLRPFVVRLGPPAVASNRTGSPPSMPHLLNVWPRVSRQIAAADHVLLLSDYDGTLAPIAERPELAILPPKTRNALVALSRRKAVSLGIVSGRELADVAAMVHIPDIIYAGNHGMEIRGPGLEFNHPEAAASRPALARILADLQASLGDLEGVIVEGKGLTLSVHHRLTPESVKGEVFSKFDSVLTEDRASESFRVTRGKEVLEVRPDVAWDKGRAISRIAESCPPGSLAIFFGDDLTDEDGFAAVHDLNGISVFVGPPRQPTRALYRVDSPAEVAQTLELLARL